MICSNCKNEIPDGSRFCTSCGLKIEQKPIMQKELEGKIRFCTKCGNTLKPGAKFCVKCGEKIEVEGSKQESELKEAKTIKTAVTKSNTKTKEKVDKESELASKVSEPKVDEPEMIEKVSEQIELNLREEEFEQSEPKLRENGIKPKVNEAKAAESEPIVDKPCISNVQNKKIRFCTGCGMQLNDDDVKCEKCGKIVRNVTQTPNTSMVQSQMQEQLQDSALSVSGKMNNEEKAKKDSLTVLIICLSILLLIAAGLVYKIFASKPMEDSQKTVANMTQEQDTVIEENVVTSTEVTTDQTTEQASTEDILAGVNWNLCTNSEISFEGLLGTNNGQYILQWNEAMSFGDNDASGQPVRLDDVNTAVINVEELPSGLLDSISANEKIKVCGMAHIENGQVVIQADEVYDSTGKDLIESNNLEDDYIIPDSDTRLLTKDDVKNLTLQEINYAKNEIYARHGRKFDSKELQKYFNSKKWYKGTISPSKFDNKGYLSTIESKNAAFLSDMENEMGGPYQLDQ